MLEWVAQRGRGCHIFGGIQGQGAWGSGKSGLVLNLAAGNPECGQQIWNLRSLPIQIILWLIGLSILLCKGDGQTMRQAAKIASEYSLASCTSFKQTKQVAEKE